MGIRTPDIQLAKLALYQLSYTPESVPREFAEECTVGNVKVRVSRVAVARQPHGTCEALAKRCSRRRS